MTRDEDDDEDEDDVLQVAVLDVFLHTVKATCEGLIGCGERARLTCIRFESASISAPFTRPSCVTCATRSTAHPMLAASARRAR